LRYLIAFFHSNITANIIDPARHYNKSTKKQKRSGKCLIAQY
jgi:hypothetical protein